MIVEKINDGTVIDHLPAGKGKKVLSLLSIDENYPHRVALMINVPSHRIGRKDIVKIEGTMVDAGMANLIALVAPMATINVIRNKKVVKKYEAELPQKMAVGRCPNPNCITGSEHGNEEFVREGKHYRCTYCERLFKSSELV